MTVGSLFSGIGGLDLGLERAGFTIKWQVENDPYCVAVLNKHWSNVPRWDDATTFPPDPECDGRFYQAIDGRRPQEGRAAIAAGRQGQVASEYDGQPDERHSAWVDLICGGFPCQPVSHAGRRMGTADDRWLWPEFARIVGILRPRYILVENVPGLLTANGGGAMSEVLGDLARYGYDAEWASLPAAAFGAPHLRYRVFLVAHPMRNGSKPRRTERPRQEWTPAFEQSGADVADAVIFSQRKPFDKTDTEPGSGQARALLGGGSWWAIEPDVGRVAHGVPARVDRLRALGNAVVPQVAEWVGRRILEADAQMREFA